MKLTNEDVQKKLARIEGYKARLREIQAVGLNPEDDDRSMGFCTNSGQVILMSEQSVLLSLIRSEEKELSTAEVVDYLEIPEDIIGLGDSVTLLMQCEGQQPQEVTFTISDELIGNLGIVSTSSPIGRAIYGKNIGDTVACKTPNGNVKITILSKVKALSL